MTREEIINGLKSIAASEGLYDDKKPSKKALILGETIKMLSTERCGDCINRQSVLNLAYCGRSCVDGICTGCIEREEIIDVADILKLPSVCPTPNTGRWIRHQRNDLGRKLNDCIECSVCKIWFSTEDMLRRSFCPNCGAKMEREYI